MSADPFRLEGQVALVTGGGSGIGLAIAQALIEAGAKVAISGRRIEALDRAVAQLGPSAVGIRHDVNHTAGAPELLDEIEDRLGPVSLLINNAGYNLKKPALATSDSDIAQMMGTHVFGSFAMSREAGARMVKRNHGVILFIGSMASLMGLPGVVAYSAAKSALLGLMRALCVELSPHGVRVNMIAPGWIETEMVRRAFDGDPEREARVLARTPAGRLGDPMDVARAAVYLCSPAARFVTGVVLPVDGGVSIGF